MTELEKSIIQFSKVFLDDYVIRKEKSFLKSAYYIELAKSWNKKAEIGETRTRKDGKKYRKIAEGEWKPVSGDGSAKDAHDDEAAIKEAKDRFLKKGEKFGIGDVKRDPKSDKPDAGYMKVAKNTYAPVVMGRRSKEWVHDSTREGYVAKKGKDGKTKFNKRKSKHHEVTVATLKRQEKENQDKYEKYKISHDDLKAQLDEKVSNPSDLKIGHIVRVQQDEKKAGRDETGGIFGRITDMAEDIVHITNEIGKTFKLPIDQLALAKSHEIKDVYDLNMESLLFKSYKLDGEMEWEGLDIAIENRSGGTPRTGVDEDGNEWSTQFDGVHYGYIRGVEGDDGDELDIFVGPHLDSDRVYIVRIKNPETSEYDEEKVMVGFYDEESAREMFDKHYDRGDLYLNSEKTDIFELKRRYGL